MVLKAIEKFIDTSLIECLLTQGEKYSDKIHFVLPIINNDVDISGCIFALRTVASEGSMTETILTAEQRDDDLLLTWDVPETVTAVPGMLQMELVGSRGTDIIIKYKMPAVYVKAAIMGDHLPAPDVLDEKLAQMNEVLSQAQAKLDEARNIAVEIDSTLTMAGQAADAKAVGDKIVKLEGLSDEITAARISSISGEEFSSLSERLRSDFALLEKILHYTESELESSGDGADIILRVTGIGSIDNNEFAQRDDFKFAEINIGGNVGTGAFSGCTELNMVTVNCVKICDRAFGACPRLNSLTIGKKVTEIGSGILNGSGFYIERGIRIMYDGTADEWSAITKSADWIGEQVTVENNVVICSDGIVGV